MVNVCCIERGLADKLSKQLQKTRVFSCRYETCFFLGGILYSASAYICSMLGATMVVYTLSVENKLQKLSLKKDKQSINQHKQIIIKGENSAIPYSQHKGVQVYKVFKKKGKKSQSYKGKGGNVHNTAQIEKQRKMILPDISSGEGVPALILALLAIIIIVIIVIFFIVEYVNFDFFQQIRVFCSYYCIFCGT